MTDCIAFPLRGKFFRKIVILYFHHFQPTKQRQRFGDCISETGSKMPRHLEIKSSGAFNFIGIYALKLCTSSHNLVMKMTQQVTPQTKRKR